MNKTITIDRAEYNRLVDLSEHALDAAAIHAFKTKLAAGEEELIPAELANRMINGESPLRVYRDYRGLTQTALAKKSDVPVLQLITPFRIIQNPMTLPASAIQWQGHLLPLFISFNCF